MVAAAVEKHANGREDRVGSAVVFCSEHASYAVLEKEAVESAGAVRKGEVDVDASGWDCC